VLCLGRTEKEATGSTVPSPSTDSTTECIPRPTDAFSKRRCTSYPRQFTGRVWKAQGTEG
jgi:hypothetical protein